MPHTRSHHPASSAQHQEQQIQQNQKMSLSPPGKESGQQFSSPCSACGSCSCRAEPVLVPAPRSPRVSSCLPATLFLVLVGRLWCYFVLTLLCLGQVCASEQAPCLESIPQGSSLTSGSVPLPVLGAPCSPLSSPPCSGELPPLLFWFAGPLFNCIQTGYSFFPNGDFSHPRVVIFKNTYLFIYVLDRA